MPAHTAGISLAILNAIFISIILFPLHEQCHLIQINIIKTNHIQSIKKMLNIL